MDTENNQEETPTPTSKIPEVDPVTTDELAQEYSGQEVTGDDLQELLSYAPALPEKTFDSAESTLDPETVAQLKVLMIGGFPIKFKKLPHYAGPEKLIPATPGSVGVDLYSANSDAVLLNSMGSIAVIPTGLCIELPVGFEAQVRSRSGLAAKHGVVVANSPGTVDSDYRGEIMLIMINHTNNRFKVERGMRLGQMVINQVPPVQYIEVDELSSTERGAGGLGSTGL